MSFVGRSVAKRLRRVRWSKANGIYVDERESGI